MSKKHTYRAATIWTGNLGEGTSSYIAYLRNFTVSAEGRPDLHDSAGSAFRGDVNRQNPEEMLLAAVSAYHKLWYPYLCTDTGICVAAYTDHAEAVMDEGGNGNVGRFVSVALKPCVTIAAGSNRVKALELYHEAHHPCFIVNSINFPTECRAEIESGEAVRKPNVRLGWRQSNTQIFASSLSRVV